MRTGQRPFRSLLLALLVPLCTVSVLAAPAGAASALTTPAVAPERFAVLLSIDGLMPASYTAPDELGLAVPNLRRLFAEGASAEGVVGVLPSVTYPSHTTMTTGLPPRLHGIAANRIFDPEGRSNEAWTWYAEDIRAPTLLTAARGRGLRTASLFWPVTVGAEVDALVPEYWRSGSSHADDLKLLRALSTPGLVAAVERGLGRELAVPLTDDDRTEIALHVLRTTRPHLLLLHLIELDHEEHEAGPGSERARKALERIDGLLGRLRAEIARLGIADRTLFAVVSDHGFLPIRTQLRPNVLLREAGLLTANDEGEVESWRAFFHASGGSAALHLADPADEASLARVRELFAARRSDPAQGLRETLGRERIAELGGDERAALVLDAAEGFAFSGRADGAWQQPSETLGTHGFAPDRPEMYASFVAAGPGVDAGLCLGIVSMTAVGPTLAAWLGLELSPGADRPLSLVRP